jgi:hypothetical protein
MLILAVFSLQGVASAANRHVLAGGRGSMSGTDWSNAAPCAKNLTPARGDVVYFGRGDYRSCHPIENSFNAMLLIRTSNSGTQTVTFRAATAADHGSDIGWDAATMEATGANPAILHPVMVQCRDFIIIDGVDRSTPTSGYRIKISNSDGAGGTRFTGSISAALFIGDPFSGCGSNNVKIRFVEVEGSGYNVTGQCTFKDAGAYLVQSNSVDSLNNTIQHSYIHDVGGIPLRIHRQRDVLVEHTWLARNHTASACHSEGIVVQGGVHNFTFRYNVMEDMEGTAYIATPSGLIPHTGTNWYFYGNVFFKPTTPARGGVGNGLFAFIDTLTHTGEMFIVNNTFVNANPGGACRIQGPTKQSSFENMVIQNNLWVNCPTDNNQNNPGDITNWTWSHNAFFDSTTNDTSATAQIVSGTDPLVNWPSRIFRLKLTTNNGFTLPSPFNLDPRDKVRGADGVWNRGAFELSRPSPPQNLRTVPAE